MGVCVEGLIRNDFNIEAVEAELMLDRDSMMWLRL